MTTGKNAVLSVPSPVPPAPSRLRLGAALGAKVSWRSWRPSRRVLWISAGAVALIALGAGAFALKRAGVLQSTLAVHPTVADLQKKVAKNPRDASARVALGHAYFDTAARARGVGEYQVALRLDPRIGNDAMVSDLLASFGTPLQGPAATLLGEYKLVQATDGLERLTEDRRYGVRLGALATLEKLGRASRVDHQRVWIHDLDTPDCDVRRHAVTRLGDQGDPRALQPLLAAKKKDDDATPWYRFRCIGGRAEDAEKKILSRQESPHLARR